MYVVEKRDVRQEGMRAAHASSCALRRNAGGVDTGLGDAARGDHFDARRAISRIPQRFAFPGLERRPRRSGIDAINDECERSLHAPFGDSVYRHAIRDERVVEGGQRIEVGNHALNCRSRAIRSRAPSS
ncbi:hypothetical protein [Burkholderia arboris]|uniref:hypothetical protein n=1 Tax=Burkholderia arboris TaxID=488730 RepID=UPI0012D91873|nr:hypothetical protein [Burkholderia arboris]MCA8489230.1 hypothetical protein [Burkholderia arboris]